MALKLKISKTEFETLMDGVKAEYKQDGDGYTLDVTGLEDTGALKRAKDRETELRTQAERDLDRTRTELETVKANIGNYKDVKTLEASYERKLADATAAHNEALGRRDSFIKQQLRDTAAHTLAAELSPKNAKVLLPHILARLDVDMTGETPVLRVLDAAGKPSASKPEDLGKEFRANKDFSGIIPVSQASGGGAPVAGGKIGGSAPANGEQTKTLAQMNSAERRDHIAATVAARNAT